MLQLKCTLAFFFFLPFIYSEVLLRGCLLSGATESHFSASLRRKSTTQPAASSSSAETTTPSSTSTTWTSVSTQASITAMPPTWSAAAKRSLCWGSAVTWPPCGLSWGFWPRSSSWSSSSLFMRSVRSQRIYKTVSHHSCGVTLFHYYRTQFLIYLSGKWWCSDLCSQFCATFSFAPKKPVAVMQNRDYERRCPFFSGVLWSHSLSKEADRVTWHCAAPAFNNSVWWGWPQADTVAEGRTLSGQFHAFNIHEKYDTAVLRRWTGSIINGFPWNLRCARVAASLTSRHSFRYTACAHQPGILSYDGGLQQCNHIMNHALMVFGWPSLLKQNFDAVTCWLDATCSEWLTALSDSVQE